MPLTWLLMHRARCFLSRATVRLLLRSIASSPWCMLLERTPLKLRHKNSPNVQHAIWAARMWTACPRLRAAAESVVMQDFYHSSVHVEAACTGASHSAQINTVALHVWPGLVGGCDTNLYVSFLSMTSSLSPRALRGQTEMKWRLGVGSSRRETRLGRILAANGTLSVCTFFFIQRPARVLAGSSNLATGFNHSIIYSAHISLWERVIA